MKSKGKLIAAAIFGLLFVLLIVLVKTVDTACIGPEDTEIGLAELNRTVHDATGVRMFWYDLTEWLGYAAIAVAGVFALTGVVQLIQRKSFAKVDRGLYALGGLYAVVGVLYVLFEKVIINYRPVIMEGDAHPEASFPSSHTMLICAVMGSAAMILPRLIARKNIVLPVQCACIAAIPVTVVGRLVSGVHWFTDILGGVLISAALLFLFAGVLDLLKTKQEK